MNIHDDITSLIGDTPLLRLSRLYPSLDVCVKLELFNPISIKDRPIKQIIADGEAAGDLKPGMTLIEATSGNTGMALAMVGAVKGYNVIIVMSEAQSMERRQVMKALGAELVLTPGDQGTAGAKKRLLELCEQDPSLFYIGQHQNPSNPRAHELTTGPEIWNDTDGQIDMFVAGLGTCGTMTGTGRYLKRMNPEIKLIAVEPEEAALVANGTWQPHWMMGVSPGFEPENLDRELIDGFELVNKQDAYSTVQNLARKEGLLVGISSGAVIHAAGRIAGRSENRGKRVVTIVYDTGQRYLSVNDLFG